MNTMPAAGACTRRSLVQQMHLMTSQRYILRFRSCAVRVLEFHRVIGLSVPIKACLTVLRSCHKPFIPQPTYSFTKPIMSGVVNKIKDKVSGNKSTSASDEQQFSIQPHPAVRPSRFSDPSQN